MAPHLTVAELIDLGDLDELLRRVDALCDDRDWDGLLDLRNRCRMAFARGRQLWPAAAHAEYRLALQAPGKWAASVVGGGGPFSLGPLTEVAASTHTWAELGPHLPSSPEAALVAHERVVRGEDLSGAAADVDSGVLELPLRLQPWEPVYPLATYRPYTAEFEDVAAPDRGWLEVDMDREGATVEVVDDPEAVHALLELVSAWTTQSNGRATAVAVVGTAKHAMAGVTGASRVRLVEVTPAHALALLAWAAASGGAHGRRRGMASGRFAAWWTLAALAAELDVWPDLASSGALERLRWFRWERLEPSSGWVLRVAAESPAENRAWAMEATDQA